MTRAAHCYATMLWHRYSARFGRTPEGRPVQTRVYHCRCALHAIRRYRYLRSLETFARREVSRLESGGEHAPWMSRAQDLQRWRDQLQDLS